MDTYSVTFRVILMAIIFFIGFSLVVCFFCVLCILYFYKKCLLERRNEQPEVITEILNQIDS